MEGTPQKSEAQIIREKIEAKIPLTPHEEQVWLRSLNDKYDDREGTDGDQIKRSIH